MEDELVILKKNCMNDMHYINMFNKPFNFWQSIRPQRTMASVRAMYMLDKQKVMAVSGLGAVFVAEFYFNWLTGAEYCS